MQVNGICIPCFMFHVICYVSYISGRSVTANMLALGASDSGFESRRPDKYKNQHDYVLVFVFVGASTFLKKVRSGFEKPEYKIFSRKFFEAVPRPDFCDDKNLSRGRNSRP